MKVIEPGDWLGLQGQVVLITGAAGGIGVATARAFAGTGARLALTDLRAEEGEELAAGLRGNSVEAMFLEADITDPDAVASVTNVVAAQFGRLDALVHIAGASGRRHGDGPAHSATLQGWDWVMNLNLRSAFLCARSALPHMLPAGSGSITFLSSVQALAGGGQAFDAVGYAAAKTGLLGMTRAMATCYASEGVRVNAICAGTVRTPMSARVQQDPEAAAYVARMQPLAGGPGEASDVASAAVWLTSRAARFVTGVALPVDGGWSAA
ncbi:MAG: SDR family NAD(P)-dependent oxidoreductase [Micromonosporaceae bacterium]